MLTTARPTMEARRASIASPTRLRGNIELAEAALGIRPGLLRAGPHLEARKCDVYLSLCQITRSTG